MSAIFPVNPDKGQRFPVTDSKWEFNGDKWSLLAPENTFLQSGELDGTNLALTLNNTDKINIDISKIAQGIDLITKFNESETYQTTKLVIDSNNIVYEATTDVNPNSGQPSTNVDFIKTFATGVRTTGTFGNTSLFLQGPFSNNDHRIYLVVNLDDYPVNLKADDLIDFTINNEFFEMRLTSDPDPEEPTQNTILLFGRMINGLDDVNRLVIAIGNPPIVQNLRPFNEIFNYRAEASGLYKVVGNLPNSITNITFDSNRNLIFTKVNGETITISIPAVEHPLEWSDIILNYTTGTEGSDATDANGNTDADYIEYTKGSNPTYFRIFNKNGLSEIIRQDNKTTGTIIATKTY